jgi:16S rRNA A1518/A1519 N6-dimethyltransferase RsmA/KsgA/DIM1 with predicted DNA glycosylase/AP lyase activity
MPLERIRDFVGAEFLSPIQQFISDGYNSKLFSNLEFLPGDKIVVLGGYIGESVQILDENYRQDVYVFEPVPEFIAVLKDRFKFKSNIKIIEAAASSEEGFLKLSIDGEKLA